MPNNTGQERPARKKNKSPGQVLINSFLMFLTALFIILVLAFIFVQTPWFNKIVLNYTVNQLNESWKTKEGKVHAESISGNIFSGVTLYQGNITVRGDALMKFSSLSVRYDIIGFLRHEIKLSEAILNDPEINITNVKGFGDSLMWNINYLFSSKEKKIDTTGFDWDVTIKDLKIHNGMLRIIGMKPPELDLRKIQITQLKQFDINNLDVFDLQAELEAEYLSDSKILNLKKLSFNTNSDFKLNEMSLEARITDKDTVTQVRNLVFKTDRSELYAENIFLNRLSPFKRINYEEFGEDNVKIVLHTPKFNFKDLTFFFPQTDFLDSTVSLDLDAEGKYKSITVNKLILNTPNSHIDLKGRIDNLDNPSKLYIEADVRNTVIEPYDTKIILPGLPVPDYSAVGKVYANFNFKGEPLNFVSDFDVSSDNAGTAKGNLNLDLNSPNYFYNGHLETTSLDIGKILRDKEAASSINLTADITGSGFDFNSLSSRVNFEVSNSRFANVNISRSSGILNISNRNIAGELTFISGSMQSAVKGSINLANFSDPKYSLKGNVRNLNVADFTKKNTDRSNLNFTFDADGRGINLNNINGSYNFVFSPSFYSDYKLPATPALLKINNSKAGGTIDLVTNIFDFKANGNFNLGEVADVLDRNIRTVSEQISRSFTDSLGTAYVQTIRSPARGQDFDFKYEFITKDSRAFADLLQKSGYKFEGKVSGELKNSPAGFISLSDIDLRNLSVDTAFTLSKLSGRILFQNDYQKISSDIRLAADSFTAGSFKLDTAYVIMALSDGNAGEFQIQGKRDTTYAVMTRGRVEFAKGAVRLNADSLFIRYGEYDTHNDGTLIVSYEPPRNTFNFENFNISDSIMKLSVAGKFSLKDNSELIVEAKNLKASEIIEYLYPQTPGEPPYASPVAGNVRRVSVNFTGMIEDPLIKLEMNTDLLRYENARVGRVDAFMDYKNSILTSDVLVSNAQGNGKLRVAGDIPVENPFLRTDTASVTLDHYPVDFKMKADNFQVNFFSKIIPNLSDINGILNGEITAKGTVGQPVLTGYMNVTKGSFYLPLTGMNYGFQTNLKTENSNLLVENFRVHNTGDISRHIDGSGIINFEGLKINTIDFSASGDIKIIDNTVDYNELGIYGNVIAGTSPPGLTVKGNLEELNLEGQFLIREANISSISFGAPSSYDIYDDNFVYNTISDTLHPKITYVSPEKYYEINPFSRRSYRIAPQYAGRGTNLNVNINLKTQRNLIVALNLGEVPKQELVGEVSADIDITSTKSHDMKVFGSIDVVGDSYYRFYRNFKVLSSRISFTGPPENPDVDFHASYLFNPTTSTGGNVEIFLDVTGNANKPEISLKVFEGGNEVSGSDAQSDAISYLLFGVPKSQLLERQRASLVQNIGATAGTTYLSSALSGVLRNIAPFVLNTEVIYSEGNVIQGTDIRITSAFGDAIVKVGGRVFSDLNNTEITVQYPLTKILGSTVGKNLILEVSRTADFNSTVTSDIRTISTGAKILYILKY